MWFLIFLMMPLALSAEPFLKLQPIFTGTEPLYPGQRFYVGYRYTYNASIDLSEEKLPLLGAKGFKKIGDKQIESGEEGGISTQQVIQKVEAIEPGTFHFPASQVAGYKYTLNPDGKKLYEKAPLISTLSPFTIQVIPYPEKGKPASFRSALGSYQFDAKLVGPNQVAVGDKIQLLLTISGDEDLDPLLPPDLYCLPGFSGYFKLSDLPPETTIKGKSKTFLIDLYVIDPTVKKIPSIEFSFFNPQKGKYEKVLTDPIPLQVTASLPESPSPHPSLLETTTAAASTPMELPDRSLQKALSYYNEGAEAKDSYLRNSAYNKSIETLVEAPSGSMNENILMGKNLVMLRQYPLAVFYYLKALKKDPASSQIRSMIEEAVNLGSLPFETPSPSSFGPPRWMWGSALVITALLLLIWLITKSKWAFITSLCSLTIFLSLIVLSLQSPIWGVIIHSDIPLQTPIKGAPASNTPLSAGAIVTVLDVVENGAWIKVKTSSGLMGYVPQNAIRVL